MKPICLPSGSLLLPGVALPVIGDAAQVQNRVEGILEGGDVLLVAGVGGEGDAVGADAAMRVDVAHDIEFVGWRNRADADVAGVGDAHAVQEGGEEIQSPLVAASSALAGDAFATVEAEDHAAGERAVVDVGLIQAEAAAEDSAASNSEIVICRQSVGRKDFQTVAVVGGDVDVGTGDHHAEGIVPVSAVLRSVVRQGADVVEQQKVEQVPRLLPTT